MNEEFQTVRRLLACYKITYYRPELLPPKIVNILTVPDSQYDSMEIRYLQLCEQLGESNTLSHQPQEGFSDRINGTGMMEIDEDHPDVKDAIAWALLKFKHRVDKKRKKK